MAVCVKHGHKTITSYCRSHEETLCIECLLQDHKECIGNIEEITVRRDTVAALAEIIVQKFSSLTCDIGFWIKRGNDALQSLKDTETNLIGGIKQIRIKLLEQVNNLENEALEVVKSIIRDQEDRVKCDIQDLKDLNNRISKMHEVIHGFRERKSSHDSVISSDEVIASDLELNQIEGLLKQNHLPTRNVKLVFYVSNDLEGIRNNLTTFGEVCVEDINSSVKQGSRPFSFTFGKSQTDDNYRKDDVDGIDTSVFALSGTESPVNKSNYSTINDTQSTIPHSTPPHLPESRTGCDSPKSDTAIHVANNDRRYPNTAELIGTKDHNVFRNSESQTLPRRRKTAKPSVTMLDFITETDEQNHMREIKRLNSDPGVSREKYSNVTLNRRPSNTSFIDRGKADSGISSTPRSSLGDSTDGSNCATGDGSNCATGDGSNCATGDEKGENQAPVRNEYMKSTPTPRKRFNSDMGYRTQSALELSCFGNIDCETPEPKEVANQLPKAHVDRYKSKMCYSDSFYDPFNSDTNATRAAISRSLIHQDRHTHSNDQTTRKLPDLPTAHTYNHGMHKCYSDSFRGGFFPTNQRLFPKALSEKSLFDNLEDEQKHESSNNKSTTSLFNREKISLRRTLSEKDTLRTSLPENKPVRHISAPMSSSIVLSGSTTTDTRKRVVSLITGMCVTHSGMLCLCDMYGHRVQLFDTKGNLIDESHIIEPFGCRHLEYDVVAITCKSQRSVIYFDVGYGLIRRTKETQLQCCQRNEIQGLGYSCGYLAVCCLNRILVLSRDTSSYQTVQPLMPDSKSNKKYFQEVMFAALLVSENSIRVFASDVRRDALSCTDVNTNTVLWIVNVNAPRDVNFKNDILFVTGKMSVSLFRPQTGQILMEIRAGVPKRPYTLTINEDIIYLSKKSKSAEKARTIEIIPFKGI